MEDRKTLKISTDVLRALRIRKANLGDKSYDETLRRLLGV